MRMKLVNSEKKMRRQVVMDDGDSKNKRILIMIANVCLVINPVNL